MKPWVQLNHGDYVGNWMRQVGVSVLIGSVLGWLGYAQKSPQQTGKPTKPSLIWTNPTPKPKPSKSGVTAPVKPPVKPTPTPTPTPLPPPATAQEAVLREMVRRPKDYWSPNKAHVILALPGSPERAKAYLEPGGGFSPGVGSFGLSFCLTDAAGNVIATSDTVSYTNPEKTSHQLLWAENGGLTGIKTHTWMYDATWSSSRDCSGTKRKSSP